MGAIAPTDKKLGVPKVGRGQGREKMGKGEGWKGEEGQMAGKGAEGEKGNLAPFVISKSRRT